MLPKISIPKAALNFIIDKTADFLVNRLSNKVDDFHQQSKSFKLSDQSFERELRKELENINNSIKNLEAVAYQGNRLYEMTLSELVNQLNSVPSTNIYIYGDVTLTLNINCASENAINDSVTELLSANKIKTLVENKAKQLFEPITPQHQLLNKNSRAFKFENIISRRNKELLRLREED